MADEDNIQTESTSGPEETANESVGEASTETVDDSFDIVDPSDTEEDFPNHADNDDGAVEDSTSQSDGSDDGDDSEDGSVSSVHDEQLIAAANALGVSESQLNSFGDKARDVVLLLAQKELAANDGAKKEDGEQEESALDKFKIEVDEDADIAPEVVELLEKQNEFYAKQFEAMKNSRSDEATQLKEQMDKMKVEAEKANHEAYKKRFDTFIDELGPEFEREMGKGSFDSLDKNSDAYNNRVKVDEMAAIIANGYAAVGHKVPDEAELLDQALNATFGGKRMSLARRSISSKVSKRNKMGLERPTNRGKKMSEVDKRQESLSVVEAKLKEIGIYDDE